MNAPQYPCLLLAAALLLGSILPATAADQTATWNSTTGNWSDPTKWNTNPLSPNNGNGGFTFDAIQNGGDVTVNQAITIEKYNLTGGNNTGAGFTLTLNDLLTWTGGSFSGPGTVTANGGSTLSGSLKTLYGPRVMNLSGTSTWSTGGIDLYFNAVLTNTLGGTLTNTFSGEMRTPSFTGGFFNNAGTFTKNTSSGTTTIDPVFNNTGTSMWTPARS
jgi:hypothetical protein